VILDAAEIIEGYPFVAKRWRRVPMCDPAAVHACCELARELAEGAVADEPAAVFFAFASRRRAFPFAWKLMATLLSRRQAEVNGLVLDLSKAAFDASTSRSTPGGHAS